MARRIDWGTLGNLSLSRLPIPLFIDPSPCVRGPSTKFRVLLRKVHGSNLQNPQSCNGKYMLVRMV